MSLDRGTEGVQAQAPIIAALRPKRTFLQGLMHFIVSKPLGAFGGAVAIGLIIVAVFAPLIANHDPYRTNLDAVNSSPTSDNWLGGDQLGRDVFSRIIYGARISLYVGIVSSFVGSTIGLIIGVASVHFGGRFDILVQRVIDAMMAFPILILAIAIMSVLGASVNNVIIALSVVYVPSTARVIRSQAMAINEMDYILAARAVGAGNWRIMLRHMIPNTFALYIVVVTFHLGGAIIAEAALSFLGVGSPIDTPSWGGMLSTASRQYVNLAPWLAVFPGLAIAIVVFSWNVLGDALRDVMDPRMRGTN